jgi:hypothetical protein
VTVCGSGVATDLTPDISEAGPAEKLIFFIRSMENLTSSDVSGCPLENCRPSWSVHWYVIPVTSR